VTGDLPGMSGGVAVIYPPPPPISTPLSSSGNGVGGGQHRQTRHRRADVVFTDITGYGAGEVGEAGDVFIHIVEGMQKPAHRLCQSVLCLQKANS